MVAAVLLELQWGKTWLKRWKVKWTFLFCMSWCSRVEREASSTCHLSLIRRCRPHCTILRNCWPLFAREDLQIAVIQTFSAHDIVCWIWSVFLPFSVVNRVQNENMNDSQNVRVVLIKKSNIRFVVASEEVRDQERCGIDVHVWKLWHSNVRTWMNHFFR